MLVAVVAATVVSAVFDLAAEGVKTVGTLPSGLPTPSFPWTSASDLATLAAAAVGIVLVSLTDTIATSSSFAARRGDEVDAEPRDDRRGRLQRGAGLFQGFAISVSGSRTAVAEQSGSKTQVTGLVGAGLVILMLVLVPGLLKDLPQTALAAVVIMAAISLADVAVLRRFAHVRKTALFLSLVATARRRLLRRAPGHPHRRHPLDPAVLPPQLVAAGRRARLRPRPQGLARHRAVSRRGADGRTS